MESASRLVEYGVLGVFAFLMVLAICYLVKRSDTIQKDAEQRSGEIVKGFIDYLTEADRRNAAMLDRMTLALEKQTQTLNDICSTLDQHVKETAKTGIEIQASLSRIE